MADRFAIMCKLANKACANLMAILSLEILYSVVLIYDFRFYVVLNVVNFELTMSIFLFVLTF